MTRLTGRSDAFTKLCTVRDALLIYNYKEVVFAGAPGTQVETSSLFRDTSTTMNGVIRFKDQKEPHIQVRWEKVAADARINCNPRIRPAP